MRCYYPLREEYWNRTHYLLPARQMLSQMSFDPVDRGMSCDNFKSASVSRVRIELTTYPGCKPGALTTELSGHGAKLYKVLRHSIFCTRNENRTRDFHLVEMALLPLSYPGIGFLVVYNVHNMELYLPNQNVPFVSHEVGVC